MKVIETGVNATGGPWWDGHRHRCIRCGTLVEFDDSRPWIDHCDKPFQNYPHITERCPGCGDHINVYLQALPNFPGRNHSVVGVARAMANRKNRNP